jgi:zinc protease
LEAALGGWKATGESVPATLPGRPAEKPTRIVLVDKPGAAQSVIAVSRIGAERKSPDFYALTVMNSIFGGQFSSRLNLNLREAKGYTYGAHSMFEWRIPQPGPFLATASVHTAVTAPALAEILKEFQGMAGARAVTADELAFSQAWLTRGYPAYFETSDLLAGQWRRAPRRPAVPRSGPPDDRRGRRPLEGRGRAAGAARGQEPGSFASR